MHPTFQRHPPDVLRTVVVDDERSVRALSRAHLEVRGGFRVVGEAEEGQAGLAAVRRHRPDLVLLDLTMPGMDGFAALPLMRAACPEAVVVVRSGREDRGVEAAALRLGAHAFLPKGLPPGDLPARLEAIVQSVRGGRRHAGRLARA